MSSEPFSFSSLNFLPGISLQVNTEPENSFPMTVTENGGNLKGSPLFLKLVTTPRDGKIQEASSFSGKGTMGVQGGRAEEAGAGFPSRDE